MMGGFSILLKSNNMRKSFPILIGLLLFWTGLSVGFADVISDAYNPVSETIRNPSNSDGY